MVNFRRVICPSPGGAPLKRRHVNHLLTLHEAFEIFAVKGAVHYSTVQRKADAAWRTLKRKMNGTRYHALARTPFSVGKDAQNSIECALGSAAESPGRAVAVLNLAVGFAR